MAALTAQQDWEANEEGGYDLDDGLTAAQRARLSLARAAQDDEVEARCQRRQAGRLAARALHI